MRRQMQFWFGMGVANSILAPIGFIGPGSGWAGVFATAMALTSFTILTLVSRMDDKARREFMGLVSTFRMAAPEDRQIQLELNDIESEILEHKPLIRIAHDIGFINGELVHRGLIKAPVEPPESDQ